MRRFLLVISDAVALVGSVGIGRASLGDSPQDASGISVEGYAGHRLAGTWQVTTTRGLRPNAEVFHADGSFLAGWETS